MKIKHKDRAKVDNYLNYAKPSIEQGGSANYHKDMSVILK